MLEPFVWKEGGKKKAIKEIMKKEKSRKTAIIYAMLRPTEPSCFLAQYPLNLSQISVPRDHLKLCGKACTCSLQHPPSSVWIMLVGIQLCFFFKYKGTEESLEINPARINSSWPYVTEGLSLPYGVPNVILYLTEPISSTLKNSSITHVKKHSPQRCELWLRVRNTMRPR